MNENIQIKLKPKCNENTRVKNSCGANASHSCMEDTFNEQLDVS